jgi:hypothetical protein
MIGVIVSALLVAGSPFRPLPGETPVAGKSPRNPEAVMVKGPVGQASNGEGVADLPYAMGRRFASLDEYLLHLQRRAGPIDLPWWRQVRPGVYEHVKHMPGAARETATRAELMKRFGFNR